MNRYIEKPWRTGGQVGRTIYVDEGDGKKNPDQFIAVATGNPEEAIALANHIVQVHNLWLAEEKIMTEGRSE